MKKRSSRLLALALTACLTVTSFSPVAASGISEDPEVSLTQGQTDDAEGIEVTEEIPEEGEADVTAQPQETETPEAPQSQETEAEAPESETPEEAEVTVDENAETDTVAADVTYDMAAVTWEQDTVTKSWKLKDNSASTFITSLNGAIVKVTEGTGEASYYTFDAAGNMLTGPQTLNGQKYFFATQGYATLDQGEAAGTEKTPVNSDFGSMAIDEVVPYDEDTYMRAGNNGVLSPISIGWIETDGNKYYVDSNGNMIKDTCYKIGSYYYAFDANGKMVSNDFYTWKSNGRTYFFNADGRKYTGTGWQKKNGSWYYFHKTTNATVVKSGMQKIKDTNGKTYTFYFDSKGVMYKERFLKKNNNKEWYYFNNLGRMATGLQRIKVSDNYLTYFFRTKKGSKGEPVGSAVTGWYKHSNGFWYYFSPTFKRAQFGKEKDGGLVKIGSRQYFLFDTGRAFKGGFKDVGDDRYYFNPQSGDKKPYMLTNKWVIKSNKWYRASANGKLVKNDWVFVGKYWYFIGSDYVMDKSCEKTRVSNGKEYKGFLDDNGRFVTNSWVKLNGNWKYIDSKNGYIKGGWKTINGYKYYFTNDGYLCQDLRKMFVGKDPSFYQIWVDQRTGVVTVMAKNSDTGKYNIPVVKFLCSVGQDGVGKTPNGTFHPTRGGRWQMLMGPSYGQYAVNVWAGIIYFHSVAGSATNPYAITASNFNRLGTPASHGCIRLCVSDAKWIYENAYTSTTKIYTNSDRPKDTKFDRPTLPKMPAGQTYDPTDPAVSGTKPSPHINPYK